MEEFKPFLDKIKKILLSTKLTEIAVNCKIIFSLPSKTFLSNQMHAST